jgi:hypothetical protein
VNQTLQDTKALSDDTAVRLINSAGLAEIGGGYPCSYLGVEDWSRMMSYESRNYSC